MPLLPVLARMELAGIRIDLDALEAMREEFAATLAGLESRIYELVGHEFNIGSPRQLETVLFDELDAAVDEADANEPLDGRIGPGGAPRQARGHRADPRASPGGEAEVDVRRRAAARSWTRRRRLHTTYQQAVAATGRLSSTDPNLQNIPIRTALGRRIRRAFVAPSGRLLLGADYSQTGAAHPRPRVGR